MDETTFECLEFGSVIDRLSQLAVTGPGRELALRLAPFATLGAVNEGYSELNEASLLFDSGLLPPLGGIVELSSSFKKLEKEGAYLTAEELLKVRGTLAALAALAGFISSREYAAIEPRLPITTARLDSIETPPALKKEIDRIIDPAGELRDGASPRLAEIRRSLRGSKQSCRNIVDGLLRDKELSGLLMEDYFTIREDRFVVCVKSSYYTQVPGIVHGRSASGETYFIEPLGTVEINNRVSILKRDERDEEISILQEISTELFAQRGGIFRDIRRAAALDLACARARFKEKIGGAVPRLGEGGPIRLIEARHPILVLKNAGKAGIQPPASAPVVPIDITLDEKKRVLVISGANTGGKTVALKTLGLLVLMAESALPVPAREGCELPFFKGIYADIGDRQSMDQELSTFSAHLKRSAEILGKADSDTLILLDEIGVGTDPVEGAALSLSILESLAEKEATVVVTTHLNLLKAHSAVDDRFENASVLFDETTSSPLYKLRYGTAGASLALAVAEEYGIPREIVERARKSLKGGEGAFVESLRKIDEEKKRLEILTASLLEKEAQKERALKRLRSDRQELHKKARLKIEAVVKKAGEDIKAHAELVKREREEAGKAAATHSRSGVKAAMRGLAQAGERAADLFKERGEVYEPVVGDIAEIAGSNARGEVVAIEGKRAEVLAGNLKVWVGFGGLRKVAGKEGAACGSKAGAGRGGRAAYKAKTVSVGYRAEAPLAINIVGFRVDQALPEVERALDGAHMAGATELEIIHGSGSGALRSAVREYLDGSPVVSGYKGGDPLAGGEGVTIAELI